MKIVSGPYNIEFNRKEIQRVKKQSATRYIIYTEYAHEGGLRTIEAYVEFKYAKRLSTLRKALPGWDIIPRDKYYSQKEAIGHILETPPDGDVYENGNKSHQGYRTDLYGPYQH